MNLLAKTTSLLALATLAACGGGDDPAPTGGASSASVTLTCNTAGYSTAVAVPTSAELTAFAGTYVGDEGQFGPNPGDPFVKSGTATVVLGASGTVTYNGTAQTVSSACVENPSGGGKILYLVFSGGAGLGALDLFSGAAATTFGMAMTGSSPASTLSNLVTVTNGAKQ